MPAKFARFLLVLALIAPTTAAGISFAKAYGDHMVLQQAPLRAVVWGSTSPSNKITITSTAFSETISAVAGTSGRWEAVLPAVSASFKAHTITAASSDGSKASLNDVLFGDVWVCSGQSNMQFTVLQGFNASEEIARAANYPNIRVMTVSDHESTTPLDDFYALAEPWSVADSSSIGKYNWTYFSAVCWFFGRDLFEKVNRPIGLIDTTWGGTPVEAWSSPDALHKCPYPPTEQGTQRVDEDSSVEKYGVKGPSDPSGIYNAMIYPLQRSTIFGAVWYQGESNVGAHTALYACQFPAMIADWRAKWRAQSQQTDPEFPFGFVQLSTWSDSQPATGGGVPVLRWAQTANYGYVPNPAMPRTFMAVAIDLGDPNSNWGDIHPRDKQAVGKRLVLGALAVAYNTPTQWTGPLVQSVGVTGPANDETIVVHVQPSSIGPGGLTLNPLNHDGFELCSGSLCSATCTANCTAKWVPATIVSPVSSTSLQVQPSQKDVQWTAVRYNWMQAGCQTKLGELRCAIYADGLPMPPFYANITK